MATLLADKAATSVLTRAGNDITSVTGTYTISANLSSGDILRMVKIPANATLLELIVSASASVASTATATVGDTGDADRFVTSGSLGGGAAALTRLNAATGHGYSKTSDYNIDITYATITTPATGAVIKLTAIYTMQS